MSALVRAPVVGLRLARPPRAVVPTMVKSPARYRFPFRYFRSWTMALIAGGLNPLTGAPVVASSSATLFSATPLTLRRMPAT